MAAGLGLRTMNDVLVKVTGRGGKEVLRQQNAKGVWTPMGSDELYGWVRAVADKLTEWGVVKGDRVVLLSENRWEWAVTDFASLALGAIDVPLYATTGPEQIGYMMRDCAAKVAVVASKDQLNKLAQAGELPALEHVLVMDEGTFDNAASFGDLKDAAKRKQVRDAAFDARMAKAEPEEIFTIIYTSGTTGDPKGVQLTHGNVASNVSLALPQFGATAEDRTISYLPVSHVFQRHVDYAMFAMGGGVAYCPKFEQLPAAMKAVKPTIFIGVPRVFEKIRQGVEHKSAHSPVKKAILGWALKTGEKHRDEISNGKTPTSLTWKIANKLVYSKIQEAFGGCARLFISGSAPLGMDSAGWFADAGINIFEGYGLTETSPVVSFNFPGSNRIGTIGPALEGVQVRFAADGEIEVKGPPVFTGYWKKPKETAEAFTGDGWFKTGDIGKIDADGFLSITDRKKEILKTSGGKMIAPGPIEGKLKANTLVAQADVVGDKHKFACVLISPNFQALESWAKAQGIAAADHAALVANDKVKAEYKRIVDEVNKTLNHHETLKRVTVVPDEWTIETGELTPSMKLKRRIVEKKYEKDIADFYKDEASARE
jgi:long-chain acyl-CoA synthetase